MNQNNNLGPNGRRENTYQSNRATHDARENSRFTYNNRSAAYGEPRHTQRPQQPQFNRQQRATNTNFQGGRGQAQYHGYSPSISTTGGVRSSRWIPLFASLLLLMITAGIFFTVAKSRTHQPNVDAYQTGIEDIDTTQPNSPSGNEDSSTNKINVSYAIKNKNTITLTDEIVSDYAIMINIKDNTIVAEKQADVMIYPASMTKIMTLIVAYENCRNFDDTFVITHEITDPLFQAGASVAGFAIGEAVTIRDLLYGAALPSGADATDALAIYTAGSIDAFVDMMNHKAAQMGLSNTHFSNPSGLHDDNHYSTPHEIALILEYALQIEGCREILSTYKHTSAPTAQNPNGLTMVSTMFSRMEGGESGVAQVIAGKTGYTNEGLHCLASMARTDNGDEYILVTAHAPGKNDPVYDCINLYRRLFS